MSNMTDGGTRAGEIIHASLQEWNVEEFVELDWNKKASAAVIEALEREGYTVTRTAARLPAGEVVVKRLLRYADDLDATDRPAFDEYDVTADIRALCSSVNKTAPTEQDLRSLIDARLRGYRRDTEAEWNIAVEQTARAVLSLLPTQTAAPAAGVGEDAITARVLVCSYVMLDDKAPVPAGVKVGDIESWFERFENAIAQALTAARAEGRAEQTAEISRLRAALCRVEPGDVGYRAAKAAIRARSQP